MWSIKEAWDINFYRGLINNAKGSDFQTLRTAWEGDLGPLSDEEWDEARGSPRMVAIATRFRLTQLKYLHRTYFTRDRLWRRGMIASPECLRSGDERGDLEHSLVLSCDPGGLGRGCKLLEWGNRSGDTTVSETSLITH